MESAEQGVRGVLNEEMVGESNDEYQDDDDDSDDDRYRVRWDGRAGERLYACQPSRL